MFIPGETVAHQFIIPFIRSDISRIFVSYYQNDHIILEKSVFTGQVKPVEGKDESCFTITLTQEESLLFQNDSTYYVQLNVVFTNGIRSASKRVRGENGIQHIREVVTAND